MHWPSLPMQKSSRFIYCTAYCLLPYWVRAATIYESGVSAGRVLSKRGIAHTDLVLYIFLMFLVYFSDIYLIYKTVDSISSQLAILTYAQSKIYAEQPFGLLPGNHTMIVVI